MLEAAGFVWVRKTGHEGNVYRHELTNMRLIVSSTPRNSSQELKKLERRIRNATGGDPMATTEQRPTAKIIAMADPFLLKEPTSKLETGARNSALVGYVKRVLDKHGPLEGALLMGALDELGFRRSAAFKARAEAGGVGFIAADGKKLVGLEHQVPEGATILGRPRELPEPSGVQATDEHPIGENNGETPEPREEPVQSLIDDGWSAGVETQAPVIELEPEALAEPVAIPVLDSWPGGSLPPADPTAIPFQAIREDGDVIAAAQLLIQSLGIKTVAPEVLSFIEQAEAQLEMTREGVKRAENLLTRIRECLA